MSEVWKPVLGMEGVYEASSLGEVRSVDRIVVTSRIKKDGSPVREHRKGRLRAQNLSPKGYPQVHLSICGEERVYKVATLVCLAFHGEPPSPRHVVAHNDGNRRNSASINLRWDTQSGNLADRLIHDTHFRGERHYAAKLKWHQVREIRKSSESVILLSQRFGVHFSTIYKIKRGEKWKEAADQSAAAS